jgi:alginate production protein
MIRLAPWSIVLVLASSISPCLADDETQARTALGIARELGISADDARPEQQRESTLFGKRVIIGGEIDASLRGRSGYALKPGAQDDDVDAASIAKLEAIWLPSDTTVVFSAARAFAQSSVYNAGGGGKRSADVALDELWLLETRLFNTPFAIQVGRQKLRDSRQWWWDDTMEAVRLHYFGSKLTAFVGAGRSTAAFSTTGPLDAEARGLLRIFGNATWEWKKRQSLELFALHQDDRTRGYAVGDIINRDRIDERDARLVWVGAHARGCVKPNLKLSVKPKLPRRLCYWGNVAQVRGTERAFGLVPLDAGHEIVDQVERRTVRGRAYDTGVSIELPFKQKPVLTLGHARGSGDRPRTPGRDGAFRQTGLQDNDGKFRGLSRFRYYGEVLRPNLSNIAIDTVALGIPFGDDSWVETVWHRYR